jgi:hypothetical protein
MSGIPSFNTRAATKETNERRCAAIVEGRHEFNERSADAGHDCGAAFFGAQLTPFDHGECRGAEANRRRSPPQAEARSYLQSEL